MKKALFVILAMAIAMSGCLSQQEYGKSFENPIVIDAQYEEDGIAKEYDWLRENGCPNQGGVSEVESQAFEEKNGHFFDILEVTCNNGEKESYYFNIDNFFGNWES